MLSRPSGYSMQFALSASLLLLALGASPADAQDSFAPSLWRAEVSDNICGVSNLRQVQNPSVVNYKKVLLATPEMKDLRARDIDPQSAQGQILRERAVDHVRRTGSQVMRRSRNCSMWKEISHRDGRVIRDLTYEVISELSLSTVSMGFGNGGLLSGSSKVGDRVVFAGETGVVGIAQEADADGDSEQGESNTNLLIIGAMAVVLAAAFMGRGKSAG